jgi:hypothetical protein
MERLTIRQTYRIDAWFASRCSRWIPPPYR